MERFGGVGKKVSGHKSGNTNAEQKTGNISKCDRRQAQISQSRANERLHDQIFEEIKEMEHTKTEEALQLVTKDNNLRRYQNGKRRNTQIAGRQDFFF